MCIIYFDNSATTKPHKEVIDEVANCMENYFGNASSAHRLGLEAEKKLNTAREKVAALIKAVPSEIVFTSGGSEANNMSIAGIVSRGDHFITSVIEHPSVINLIKSVENEGVEVTYLDVDENGLIDLKQLESSIKPNTRLVSIMYVNNEIGSIQDIDRISKIIKDKSRKAKLHVDGVQALGKLDIDVKRLGVDIMSMSAHKIHGPRGIGALYIKRGIALKPLIYGGGQEGNIRSGTENLPGASGFGVAADIAARDTSYKYQRVKEIKSHFINRLREIDGVKINSPFDETHINNILNVSFEGVKSEVLLHALEDYDIYISTGSACSAKDNKHANYVLPAIGLKSCHIEGAVRFSFSYINTIEEVDFTVDSLKKALKFLRRI